MLRTNTFVLSVVLFFTTSAISADSTECKTDMDVYNKSNTITGSLLYELSNPNLREITDHYGKESQKANALVKEGKYQEACDIYQAVIDKYGFKTAEERYYEQHPEKRPENQKVNKQAPAAATSSSSTEAAASSSSDSVGAASISD